MTPQDHRIYFDVVAMICALMTFLNLARVQSRGLSAYFLGLAFLVLGGTVMLYATQGLSPWIYAGGVCVAGLLIADIVYRTSRASK